MSRLPRSPAARRALVAGAVLLIVLLVAQIALPALAERRLRNDLEDVAEVRAVDVDAFPAIRLLWRDADEVRVRLGEVRASQGRVGDLLEDGRRVDEIEATTPRARLGSLDVRNGVLRKDGDRLVGEATLSEGAVLAALPLGFRVRPVRVEDGQLVVRGSVEALGGDVGPTARVVAEGGDIVVRPDGVPIVGGLVQVTVFDDRRVAVQRVTARPAAGGFRVRAVGRLR